MPLSTPPEVNNCSRTILNISSGFASGIRFFKKGRRTMENIQKVVPRIQHIEELKEIVSEVLEVEEDEITETSLFKEDHDADSLRAIEILARIEKKYNIDIPQEQLAQITHLQALYEVVKAAAAWNDIND
jgi:acyl carrier protein